MTQPNAPWWMRGIVYQIYPRSFMDSNGDGVGDLRGIASKLDYIQWLGIDAIWISPIYPSPMHDFGYDVSDYTDINPLFGTLADFDHLLAEAHERGIKVLLDLVPNHTSSDHPWFIESRSSRDNPKRDWYIWRDAKPDGSPPNNWLAYFGGPAWTWDENTQQYYLHNFLPEQPDLNYRNEAVCQAMFDNIRFWLRRGVDGFRVDVIDRMIKDDINLRDNPPNPDYVEGVWNPQDRLLRVYSEGYEGIHDLIHRFRAVFDEFDDRVMIGEIAYSIDPDYITSFYGEGTEPYGSEIHQPFNFALMMIPWEAEAIRAFVDAYDKAIPPYGWGNYVLGNHDRERLVSRVGAAQARNAAMLLLTLRGTPTIYYGEELGMSDVPIPPEQYQDPQGINLGISRDPERTPMQWDEAPNGGFAPEGAAPWLPLAADFAINNVESQMVEPRSMLNFYRKLIALRKSDDDLLLGEYQSVNAPLGVFAYRRGQHYLVALNFTDAPQSVDATGEIVVSTKMDRGEKVNGTLVLRPNEGVIVKSGS